MAAAPTTASYSFTDEEVSRLAKCDDQPEFLLLYRRLLQSKGIDPTAVFDAQTTLGSSTDYGASVAYLISARHIPEKISRFLSTSVLVARRWVLRPSCSWGAAAPEHALAGADDQWNLPFLQRSRLANNREDI